MAAASLQALLAHTIDYAGIFPPCSLELESALRNQANYIRNDQDVWMLGSFVLPIAKFDEAKNYLAQFDPKHALRISALGVKSEDASAFRETLADQMRAMHDFVKMRGAVLSITQLEMPLPKNFDASLLSDAHSMLEGLPTFFETSPDKAEETIALLAENNSEKALGFKLRTGGVTPDAFPTSAQIARALVAAAKHRVRVKFTAGLHHPLRMFRDEVKTKMHGFLNVLGAAVLAPEHNWDERQTEAMLEDENASSFSFAEDSFAWREWKIGVNKIKERRKLVTSFGSCSFDEPREDLRALNFL
jgi:hypothetical protein